MKCRNNKFTGFLLMLAVIAAMLYGIITAAYAETSNTGFKMAGNCVFYEDGGFKCEKRTLVILQGIVQEVRPFDENETGIIVLDDECVIFPGLADLHSHVDYNMIQIWGSLRETRGLYWDNRHEWRKSQSYKADIKDTQGKIAAIWNYSIMAGNGGIITAGDVMLYMAELQAACGGTTVLQEASPPSNTAVEFGSLDYDDDEHKELTYSFAEKLEAADVPGSHSKYLVLRSTGIPKDLGFADNKSVLSIVDLYKPDSRILSTDRKTTYLPHRDTSSWEITDATSGIKARPVIDILLEEIQSREKKNRGFLIHLAEGRAGNIFWIHPEAYGGLPGQPYRYLREVDKYSRREFLGFRDAVLKAEAAGKFTAEDVRQTHINFIHGCGIDLTSDDDRKFISEYGIGIIWSPVSNLLLYGDTPEAYNFLDGW